MLWDHPRTSLRRHRSALQAEPFDPRLPFRIQPLSCLELDPVAHIQLYDLRTRNIFLEVRFVTLGRLGARHVAQRRDPQRRLADGPGFLRNLSPNPDVVTVSRDDKSGQRQNALLSSGRFKLLTATL